MELFKYLDVAMIGLKIYLRKEKREDIPKAKAFMKKMGYLDIFTKTLLCYWILSMCLRYFNLTLF